MRSFRVQYWAGPPLGVQILYTFPSCGFLRNRLESQSWNSFNPFPIVNRVSAVYRLGKTPQTSKLAQNCGKKPKFCISNILTESARVMKSKSPNVNKGFIYICYCSLTGWYWTLGDTHNPTRKVAALGVWAPLGVWAQAISSRSGIMPVSGPCMDS